MKLYYKAVTQDGKMIRGIVEAKDINEGALYLRKHQFIPITVQTTPDKGLMDLLAKRKKFGAGDLVFFTRQLSSMLSSGLTLMQSLAILRNQVQNERVREVIGGIVTQVEEGKSFYAALAKYPQVFSDIYVSLIKAAEESGLLDKILLRLADNLEKQAKLRSTVKSALMYPIIVVSLMVVVVVVMMIFVIPQLSVLYTNLNIPLPLPTQIVIGLSTFTITFWPGIVGIGFALLYFYRRWHKTATGRRTVDTLILRAPIFGKLITQSIMTEFTRTLGLLIGTGTLVVDALSKSADVVGNVVYRTALLDVGRRVEKGVSIGNALEANNIFPPILVEMTKIGEQTGKLDESLTRVSEYFEREVEQMVKNLTTAMEPIIIVTLACGVGFLIISIITPIYNLISQIS